MIPQLPVLQGLFRLAAAAREPLAEAVEEGIKVVVLQYKRPIRRFWELYSDSLSMICSRSAVLPAPCSPKTTDVAGVAGLP